MRQLGSIQYLRAFAALAVVIHHALNSASGQYDRTALPMVFQAGVDVFFVISGFIIYTSYEQSMPSVGGFVWRRLTRIAPLYWLFTLLLVGKRVVEHRTGELGLTPQHLALSMSFIPHESPATPGTIWPILVPGWTLCYEMFFYALFAVAIAVGRRTVALSVTAALTLFLLAGAVLHPADYTLRAYTSPVLIEFLAGLGLGWVYLNAPQVIGKHLAWLVPAAFALFAASVLAPGQDDPTSAFYWSWRVLAYGVPALLLVTGTLALELNGTRFANPAWLLLGNASYSIYLSHDMVVSVAHSVAKHVFHRPGTLALALNVGFVFVAAAVVGVLVYRWIETPVLGLLKPKRKQAAPVLATA